MVIVPGRSRRLHGRHAEIVRRFGQTRLVMKRQVAVVSRNTGWHDKKACIPTFTAVYTCSVSHPGRFGHRSGGS